ncbi:MAG: single-stranded DNA-binding protein [Burkholderiales bacterium]
MNVFNFTGRIGKDCETRFIPSGDAITNFTAAVDSGYGDKKVTTWLNCAMWGKRGEALAPYLLKGTQIAVSGELTNREYTDKEGNKRYSLDVRVNDLTLIGSKQEGQRDQSHPAHPARQPAKQEPDFTGMDSDVPF